MPNICEIVLQFGNCVDYNILNLHMSQIVFYLRIKKIHNNSNKNEQLNWKDLIDFLLSFCYCYGDQVRASEA